MKSAIFENQDKVKSKFFKDIGLIKEIERFYKRELNFCRRNGVGTTFLEMA